MAEIVTKEDLTNMVVERSHHQGISLLEALNELVEDLGIEPDDIKSYLSDSIKAKLEAEAMRLHLLKQKNNTKRLF